MEELNSELTEQNIPLRGEASPTIALVTATGINQIDSLLSGLKWGTNSVTFSFPTSQTQYTEYSSGQEPSSNFIALNYMQQNIARETLAKWASVCNLNFTETTGGNGDIRFGTSSLPSTSWAYYPYTNGIGGDVWFGNSTYSAPKNPVVGNYAYYTYLHEIGHALGLKHPHETDYFDSGAIANSSIDSVEFSVMSYRGYVGASTNGGITVADGSYPTSLMMSDIAAIQYMYGANYAYNAGDTVYKFDPNKAKIFETIWDGGGNDTYDLSAYSSNLRIDLTPGGWSTFSTAQLAYLGYGHYARGSVANALLYNNNTQSLIENAIGGSGKDTLIGNQINNILNGGLGIDLMSGGAGNDTYMVDNTLDVVVEKAGEGTDTVQSSSTYTLSDNVENLTLTGMVSINGKGNLDNNIIIGNNANNVLDGNIGADEMSGGLGNDTYVVDNVNDDMVENFNEGTDTVQSSITYTLGSNIENLTLIGTACINGTGNSDNNAIIGNNCNNVLNGGLGADKMIGGAGSDTYIIDNALDVVTEAADGGIDTVQSSITYTLNANVENLTLTGIDSINGTGNELSNVIIGNSGNNLLNGGLGADFMLGGAGDDIYVVDNDFDFIVENAGEGEDTVQSSIAYMLGSNVENLTLTGTGSIAGYGNELANVITGNSGNNFLEGGAGNDILYGGEGNDTLYGGIGNDVLEGGLGNDTYLFGSGVGNDTINSDVGNNLDNGFDIIQFQNVLFSGAEFTQSNNDLICTIRQTGEVLRISNWFLGVGYQVDQFQFADRTVAAALI